jgi:hypothetical protein
VLWVERHVVPAVPSELVLGVVLIAVLLLLGNERPLLIHLKFAGLRRVGHQFVVRVAGMGAGGAAVVADGIGMDLDQACRLEDAAALVDVFEDRENLVLRQVGAVERGPLAFGEAGAAGAAREQAILPGLAESAGDGEISGIAAAEVRALGILATETRQIVHGLRCGLEREARTRLEALL